MADFYEYDLPECNDAINRCIERWQAAVETGDMVDGIDTVADPDRAGEWTAPKDPHGDREPRFAVLKWALAPVT